VSLKLLPSKGPNGVTGVNGDDGEEKVKVIHASDRVPQLGGAKLAEMEVPQRPMQKVSDDEYAQSCQQPLPRLSRHMQRD
jgi:hypothetical protein